MAINVGDRLPDGSATFTRALGLELDLTARGMGVRNVEQPGALILALVGWLSTRPAPRPNRSS
jgi:hypothetical protein